LFCSGVVIAEGVLSDEQVFHHGSILSFVQIPYSHTTLFNCFALAIILVLLSTREFLHKSYFVSRILISLLKLIVGSLDATHFFRKKYIGEGKNIII
jgi:hypothetical protein